MTIERFLAGCVVVLAGMTWAAHAAALDEETERWGQSTWRITLELDAPNLIPPAVQWTILDKDPTAGFRARLKRMQSYHSAELEGADDVAGQELARSSYLTVNWNLGFKEVTGDQVYLLVSAPDVSPTLSSNEPSGKKWIVTKIVRIKGKPVCWCIPVEVEAGKQISITLGEKNVFALKTVHDETMRTRHNE